ncbi:MAG: YebC/PmpR family DNA-binding transcriptional regulator [Patescibacteria group bacterium]|jgi:YebC/PmpR family DNA-binding regulatory protein|nr:YebC/PmpR family DNA-binding transcriptional regulator [Patescibacteria group bacterium]
MSGHSKWAKLKHFKGALDIKKSNVFTKMAHAVTIAAREGGGDPVTNFKLRLAMEKARQANVPKENIERAVKKGTGELGGEQIEEVIYEAFGPEGTMIVIKALTDNKNRTTGSLRRIFNKYNGSLGGQNSVLWMFERKGVIRASISPESSLKLDDLELKIIDLGVDDVKPEDDGLMIYCKSENLQKIKEGLEKESIKIDYADIEWVAKDPISVDESIQKKLETIIEEIEDDQDVEECYSNVE